MWSPARRRVVRVLMETWSALSSACPGPLGAWGLVCPLFPETWHHGVWLLLWQPPTRAGRAGNQPTAESWLFGQRVF